MSINITFSIIFLDLGRKVRVYGRDACDAEISVPKNKKARKNEFKRIKRNAAKGIYRNGCFVYKLVKKGGMHELSKVFKPFCASNEPREVICIHPME